MKRVFSILCCLCFVVGMLILPVNAEGETSGECGDNAKWSFSGGTLTISGSGKMRDYIYSGANIWPNIISPWREELAMKIKKIVIKSGITYIGDNAFAGLGNVTSVSIPNTVTVIGQAAFADNKSLKTITIPKSVTTIEKSAFRRCAKLTSIIMPTELEELGESCFNECDKLSKIDLPKGVTKLKWATFEHCYALTQITIPEGYTEIGSRAFIYSGLSKIKLPKSLEEIDPSAFASTELKTITIPAKVNYIGQDAFAGCNELSTIHFLGDAPKMDSHIFNQITATAYYPRGNDTWTEAVRKNYAGEITWIAYCSDGHQWEEWVTEREPSCSKEGLKVRGCGLCDMKEEESIAKTAHQYTSVVTPPTCKDDGFTTHTCSVCDHSYTNEKTPAGTHVFGQWEVLTPATCVEKGLQEHVCSVCNTKETGVIELAEHTYQQEITLPTCTQEGFTTHTCTLCQHQIVDTPTTPIAHAFGPWNEVRASSFSEEGEKTRICQDCGLEEKDVIPKKEINWGLVIGVSVAGLAFIVGGLIVIRRLRKR